MQISLSSIAQTVYQTLHEIKFNIPQDSDKQYTALIILQSDGSNQVRILYNPADTLPSITYTVPLIFNKTNFKNIADTLKSIINFGNNTLACPLIYFDCFSRMHYDDTKNNNQVSVMLNGQLTSTLITSFKYLRREELTKQYAQQFFDTTEQFYIDLFNTKNKKIKSTPWMYYVNIANTIDGTIGKGCTKDYIKMKTVIHDIAFEMNMPVVDIDIVGKNISKQKILTTIDNLKPTTQDIVFFYYTGHGFSYLADTLHKYPQLDLRTYPPSNKIAVINKSTKNIAEIFELLKAKKARFNFVLSDCCNSTIPFRRPLRKKNRAITRATGTPIPANKIVLENLFLKPNTSILTAAAAKGQFAISDEYIGSIFTYNFTYYLIKSIWGKNDNITWQNILKSTQNKTLSMSIGYDIGGGKPGYQKAISNIIQ